MKLPRRTRKMVQRQVSALAAEPYAIVQKRWSPQTRRRAYRLMRWMDRRLDDAEPLAPADATPTTLKGLELALFFWAFTR